MPFEKVETQVDFPAQESATLRWWQENGTFEKLRQRNRGGPRWSFLDGPITANNPMGVHHAWGRTYKDAFQRYHAMLGQELRYQNGFDCQGLWVEVEVEKDLKKEGIKLDTKRDLENLVPGDAFASIDRFVRMCKDRVDRFARVQTEQSIRLGYWMDWDREEDWQKPAGERRSYFTMSEENNYTIWAFLKKCHERGLVYKAYDAMPWCPRCAVGISQQEMNEGYVLVAHRAVFVRFPLRDRPNENLLVWTTTPWTLSSNVGAAVNPELTYLKVSHKDQVYYVAKGAFTAQRQEEQFKKKEWVEGVPKLKSVEQLFKEKGGYEIVGEVKGADMVGWTYDGPYDDLPAQQHPAGFPEEIARVVRKQQWAPDKSSKELHRVVAWKDVGETEGTGIVHIAPGCGKEDFALGKEEGLPPIAPLDDNGVFLPGFGELEGKAAYDHATADWILDNLKKRDVLVAVERYPHNYPHCWRCKTELLFRLVDEWFISMSWRDEIKRVVEDVTFLPESINGKAREQDWLTNMGDWMISKKRYWGLALPIWVCEKCDHFDVVGSAEELKQRAVAGWDRFAGHTPHRPWIDLVKVNCTKCGGTASRIPDVGNPWLDAGIVPFSTMGWNRDRASWEKWFPADFITECFPGQFRNWFYAILAMSTMMVQRAPFKVLLGHALVRDQNGKPMHKSSGNAIPFEGAAELGYWIAVRPLEPKESDQAALRSKVEGALELRVEDIEVEGKKVRALMGRYPPMGADVMRWMYCRQNPAQNINFGPVPADEVRARFVLKLWNTYAFFCNYARLDGFDPNAAQAPLEQRTDLDRWLLSDLQLLIAKARSAFESYNLQAFCLEAEKFVDDKLSNWYVRRSKRRFWKNEHGTDKLAAYQTLHTVLVTLAKLFAPILPFLAEEMYRNLVPVGGQNPESVHLCAFPEPEQRLVDEPLSADMDALLDLITVGAAARNTVKIRVRQPLAEMKVLPGSDAMRRAVERFGGLLREELNVKTVTLHDPKDGPLLTREVRLNPKAGSRLKERLRAAQEALAQANPDEIAQLVQEGKEIILPTPTGPVTLEPADIWVQLRAPEGWAGAVDGPTQVLLDTRLTEALAREGVARDVVRHVQELRKKADLEMDDRIELYLAGGSPNLAQAIDAHRDYIAGETLTARWAAGPLDGDAATANVRVEGQPLTIALRKV
jgi:isoleucyl-tRNA synthetase